MQVQHVPSCESMVIIDGNHCCYGPAVTRDDGGRPALGPGNDLGEVRTGIPDAELALDLLHNPVVYTILCT